MANVIITLPKTLWIAIKNGWKTYECRKNIPKNVTENSKVYVVLKGTSKVAGCFTVDSYLSTNNFNEVWRYHGHHLFIDRLWFDKYVQNHKGMIHLWKISRVWEFQDTIDLEEYFGVKHNPQSFIYTDKEPFVRQTLVRMLDVEIDRMITPSTWFKGYLHKDLDE